MLCGFVRGKEAPVGKRLHYCTSPPDQEKGFEFSHYLFLYLFLIYGARSCTSRFRKSTENNFLLVKLSVKIDYNYSEQLTCINFFQCFWITPFFCGYRNWHSFIHAERLYSLIAEEKGFSKNEVIFFFLLKTLPLLVKYVGEKKYVDEEFSVCWWHCLLTYWIIKHIKRFDILDLIVLECFSDISFEFTSRHSFVFIDKAILQLWHEIRNAINW